MLNALLSFAVPSAPSLIHNHGCLDLVPGRNSQQQERFYYQMHNRMLLTAPSALPHRPNSGCSCGGHRSLCA
jgi:hypothetical protein